MPAGYGFLAFETAIVHEIRTQLSAGPGHTVESGLTMTGVRLR